MAIGAYTCKLKDMIGHLAGNCVDDGNWGIHKQVEAGHGLKPL